MHPILNATPPNLCATLTHSVHGVHLGNIDASAAYHTSMAQHVLDATEKATLDNAYHQRCAEQAEEAWIKAQIGPGRNWQRLFASQHLHTNMANIAAVARHLGLPFAQIVLDDHPQREIFGEDATVAATLFEDNSFLVHVDGRIAVPDDSQEPVLYLEETSVEDLQNDISAGRAAVLVSQGMDLDTGWQEDAEATEDDEADHAVGYTNWTPVSELMQVWHDHDDPPFEGGEEWNNISETPVMDQLLDLFLALAGPDSTASFSVESSSYDNEPGIQDDTFESEDFPGDLYKQVADATIDFSYVTGGSWEYNDGPDGRKSGYSFSASAAYVTYGPEDWNQATAHKRLQVRHHLLEMARTDPRLEQIRADLLDALEPAHKEQAA